MKYRFISDHRSEFPVRKMCHVLDCSRSGYYDWQDRPASLTAKKNQALLRHIQAISKDSYGSYGSPRMREELNRMGYRCSVNTIARIMKENQIRALPRKRFVHTTDSNHDYVVFPNLLNRDFTATTPNQKWVSDITYVWVDGGWKYLCVIVDLFSRKVVGWAFNDHMRSSLLIDAFLMAVTTRKPQPGLIFHSDRGIQYAGRKFRRYAALYGVVQSMSRRGNCWDNSCAESFFRSIKTEFINKRRFLSMWDAKHAIFEYIESFYNTRRLHSYLEYKSPMEFETITLN